MSVLALRALFPRRPLITGCGASGPAPLAVAGSGSIITSPFSTFWNILCSPFPLVPGALPRHVPLLSPRLLPSQRSMVNVVVAPTGPVWGVPRVKAKEPRQRWMGGRGRHPGVGVMQVPALVLTLPTWYRSLYPVNLNFGVQTCIDSSFTLVVRIFYRQKLHISFLNVLVPQILPPDGFDIH